LTSPNLTKSMLTIVDNLAAVLIYQHRARATRIGF
jgi:hypothetical protein